MALDKTMLEIAQLPEFRALPENVKQFVRDKYFDKIVAPKIKDASEGDIEEAKTNFSKQHDFGDAEPEIIALMGNKKFMDGSKEDRRKIIERTYDRTRGAQDDLLPEKTRGRNREKFIAENTLVEDDKGGWGGAVVDMVKNVPQKAWSAVTDAAQMAGYGGEPVEIYDDEGNLITESPQLPQRDYLTDKGFQGYANRNAAESVADSEVYKAKYKHLKNDYFDPVGAEASLGYTVAGIGTSAAMMLVPGLGTAGATVGVNAVLGAADANNYLRDVVMDADRKKFAKTKQHLTPAEQNQIINEFEGYAVKHGLIEGGTELAADVLTGGVMKMVPGGKTFGKKLARAGLGLGVEVAGEHAGETAAGYYQNPYEVIAGTAEPLPEGFEGVKQAFKDQFGATNMMLGLGKGPMVAGAAMRKARGGNFFEFEEDRKTTGPNAPEAGTTATTSPENPYQHQDLITPAGGKQEDTAPADTNPNSPFNAKPAQAKQGSAEVDMLNPSSGEESSSAAAVSEPVAAPVQEPAPVQTDAPVAEQPTGLGLTGGQVVEPVAMEDSQAAPAVAPQDPVVTPEEQQAAQDMELARTYQGLAEATGDEKKIRMAGALVDMVNQTGGMNDSIRQQTIARINEMQAGMSSTQSPKQIRQATGTDDSLLGRLQDLAVRAGDTATARQAKSMLARPKKNGGKMTGRERRRVERQVAELENQLGMASSADTAKRQAINEQRKQVVAFEQKNRGSREARMLAKQLKAKLDAGEQLSPQDLRAINGRKPAGLGLTAPTQLQPQEQQAADVTVPDTTAQRADATRNERAAKGAQLADVLRGRVSDMVQNRNAVASIPTPKTVENVEPNQQTSAVNRPITRDVGTEDSMLKRLIDLAKLAKDNDTLRKARNILARPKKNGARNISYDERKYIAEQTRRLEKATGQKQASEDEVANRRAVSEQSKMVAAYKNDAKRAKDRKAYARARDMEARLSRGEQLTVAERNELGRKYGKHAMDETSPTGSTERSMQDTPDVREQVATAKTKKAAVEDTVAIADERPSVSVEATKNEANPEPKGGVTYTSDEVRRTVTPAEAKPILGAMTQYGNIVKTGHIDEFNERHPELKDTFTFDSKKAGMSTVAAVTIKADIKDAAAIKDIAAKLKAFHDEVVLGIKPEEKTVEQSSKGEVIGNTTLHNRQYFVNLFEHANLSTLAHESSHVFFLEFADIIRSGSATPQMVKDWNTLCDFVGADPNTTELTKAQHEKLARAFETYLAEGKAPSAGLKSVFERFKNWMMSVYRSVVGAGAQPTDAVRDVFSRMLSSGTSMERSKEELAERERVREEMVQSVNDSPKASMQARKMAGSVEAYVDAVMQLHDRFAEFGEQVDGRSLLDYYRRLHFGERVTEIAAQEVAEHPMPEVGDISVTPSTMLSLNQWQNLEDRDGKPGWYTKTADWLRADGRSEEEVQAYLDAVRGQMAIFESLGAKIEAVVQGAGQAKRGNNRTTATDENGNERDYSFITEGPVRSNADPIYVVTFDASSSCVKRLNAANTALQVEREIGRPLNGDEQITLVAISRSQGKEAPCLYCYVESGRNKARDFLNTALDVAFEDKPIPSKWKADPKQMAKDAIAYIKKNDITRDDIHYEYLLDSTVGQTDEAIEEMKTHKPVYDLMKFCLNVAKSNKVKPYEEYKGEFLNMTKDQVELINGFAGFRFFSSSDFQVEHVIDVMQALWDLNSIGGKAHGYTKVPLTVHTFGDTGLKWNMSCFAKMTADGQIAPDTAQGWNWEEARKFREDHPDCGTVMVTANDKVLKWALEQDWIDYCIPFHMSAMQSQHYGALGYQDSTGTQLEDNIYAADDEELGMGFHEKIQTSIGNPERAEIKKKHGSDKKAASVEYVRKCIELGLIPIKKEHIFEDILNDDTLTVGKKRKAAFERCKAMIDDGTFDPSNINPGLIDAIQESSSKEGKYGQPARPHVRMHEMGTQTGISNAEGTRRYLQICFDKKIYPVFTPFIWKDVEVVDLQRRDGETKEHFEKRMKDARSKQTKAAKLRWKEMVKSGAIDWNQINPNAFKFKKDYARTDTPFRVVDPTKIHTEEAFDELKKTLQMGLEEKYKGDPEVARDLVRLIKWSEKHPNEPLGQLALRAMRSEEDIVSAITGEKARETNYAKTEPISLKPMSDVRASIADDADNNIYASISDENVEGGLHFVDVIDTSTGEKVQFGINVENTRAKFVDSLLDSSADSKWVETRTPESWRRMKRAGIDIGSRVALVEKKKIKGFVTIADIVEYANKDEFRNDVARHKVAQGSKYDYDENKGKIGIVVSNPRRLDAPIPLVSQRNREGYRRLANEDGGVLYASKKGEGKGISSAEVHSSVDAVDQKFGTSTQVVESFDDLPAEVRTKFSGDKTRLEGVNVRGTVYLVAGNIKSKERAAQVWMHEHVGHDGFESLMSEKEKFQLTNRLFAMLGGVNAKNDTMRELKRLAIKYGQNLNTAEGRDTVMREYLARLAESETLTDREQAVWKRMWNHIASTLRKAWHKLTGDNVALAEDEIRDILRSMKRQVTEGERARKADLISKIMAQVAWHGTPYDFDRFTLDNIGGGEGAQAHGWGLYFAKNREVSQGYMDSLSGEARMFLNGKPVNTDYSKPWGVEEAERLVAANLFYDDEDAWIGHPIQKFTREKVVAAIDATIEYVNEERGYANDAKKKLIDKSLEHLKRMKSNPDAFQFETKQEGQLYKVDIPEDNVLLGEEEHVNEMPKDVIKGLKEIAKVIKNGEVPIKAKWGADQFVRDVEVDSTVGEELYSSLSAALGGSKKASLMLNEHGIKGIRYDGRRDGSCFVVFDDKSIDILEKVYASMQAFEAQDEAYLDAIERGDMDAVRKMVEEKAAKNGFTDAIPEQMPSYKVRTGAAPKKTIKVYKTFFVDASGRPSALFVNGNSNLPQNVWLDATDAWHFTAANGKQYVPSMKNPNRTKGGKTGQSIVIPNAEVRKYLEEHGFIDPTKNAQKVTALAYRPGWHAGQLPFFPQGGTKNGAHNYDNAHSWNQVVFECEMAFDKDYTKSAIIKSGEHKGKTRYTDMQEMPMDGGYRYATNPMTNAEDLGTWFISGALKIGRALTQQECDSMLAENGYLPQEWEQGEMNLANLGYTGEENDAAKKTLAPVTYDDNGNIIPLSQRFDPSVDDIRYSIADSQGEAAQENLKLTKAVENAVDKANKEGLWKSLATNAKMFRAMRKERVARSGALDKEDVGAFAMFRQGFWLGRKNPAIKAMMDAQSEREDTRTAMTQEFTERFKDAYEGLSAKGHEYLRNITVQLDRATMDDPVTGEKGSTPIELDNEQFNMVDYIDDQTGKPHFDKDGQVKQIPDSLNDAHYEELRGKLKAQADRGKIDDMDAFNAAVDAYIEQRRAYDQMALSYMKHLRGMKAPHNIIDAIRKSMKVRPFYFPHQRYGNWAVIAKDKDGNTIERIHFDAANKWSADFQAGNYIKALKEQYPDADVFHEEIKRTPEDAFDTGVKGVDVMRIIEDALAHVEDKDTEEAEKFRKHLAKSAADIFLARGIGQRQMHRQTNYIAGFETDNLMKTMVMHASGLAGAVTKFKAAHDFTGIMQKYLEDNGSSSAKNRSYAWMKNFAQDVLRNSDYYDRLIDKAKSSMYLWYLGANIKSGAVNLTQNPTIGMPIMAAEMGTGRATIEYFSGARKAIMAMLRGKKNGTVRGVTADENRFLDEFWNSKAMRDTYARELRGIAGGPKSAFMQKVMAVIGAPMEYSERFNRLSFGLANFRAAMDGKITNKQTCEEFGMKPGKPWTYEAAVQYVQSRTRMAHGGFGKGERAQVFRHGNLGRTLNVGATFKSIQFNNLELWKAMLTDMGAEGRKAFALSMAAHMVFGGAVAIPFLGTFAPIAASALSELFGGDDDPERYLKKHLGDASGETAYDVIMYGVPAVGGVTVKGSLETSMPLSDLDLSRGWTKGMSDALMKNIFGAGYSMLEKPEKAYKAATHGRYQQAVEYILPSAFANVSKAERLYREGDYTSTGRPIPAKAGDKTAAKFTGSQAALQALGFASVRKAKQWDQKAVGEYKSGQMKERKADLVDKYIEAVAKKDRAAINRLVQEWRDWNSKHTGKMVMKPLPELAKAKLKAQAKPLS